MSATRRLLCCFVAITHVTVTSLLWSPSTALAQSVDVEPPTIEFERIERGVLGDTQVFSTTVLDDREVAEVTLHYRFGADAPYESVSMIALAGTSIHTASIPTTLDTNPNLQYYLEARDTSGNRSIQGFAFDPLERQLVAAESTEPAAVAQNSAPPIATDGISTGRKVFYGILGVIAVGALAAAAGGSGGGGGNELSADDPNTIPLTITVDPL